MNTELFDKLNKVIDKDCIYCNEPMSRHTTFRVGGNADFFVTPQSIKEATDTVRLLLTEKEPFEIVGNGSNLLVTDSGIRGCVVCIGKGMDRISVNGNTVTAEAGAMLSKIAQVACDNNLAGMVFASGIPGTIGGAMVMNAGAYGGEMKDIVTKVTMLDIDTGKIVTLDNEQMCFGYRTSVIKSHPYVVLSVELELVPGNRDEIKNEMAELSAKRREKQPLEYPSAGSTFKRPEGYFAGKLIEDSGLRGYCVGGAQVSEKHCGFVINRGEATAQDILTLISNVRNKVKDQYGVILEPEVCILGEEML